MLVRCSPPIGFLRPILNCGDPFGGEWKGEFSRGSLRLASVSLTFRLPSLFPPGVRLEASSAPRKLPLEHIQQLQPRCLEPIGNYSQ